MGGRFMRKAAMPFLYILANYEDNEYIRIQINNIYSHWKINNV